MNPTITLAWYAIFETACNNAALDYQFDGLIVELPCD
jgi:hypothetical protein